MRYKQVESRQNNTLYGAPVVYSVRSGLYRIVPTTVTKLTNSYGTTFTLYGCECSIKTSYIDGYEIEYQVETAEGNVRQATRMRYLSVKYYELIAA